MKTNLISKAVMFAVFALNTGAYAEGFNLERISKDTLDQAYIGGVADQGVETSALDTAAQAKAPAAAERPAAAKPALAAKVPMPAVADSKQYKDAFYTGGDDTVDIALFIPRVIASGIAAPIAIVMMVGGGGSVVKWLYRTIWGG